jgi:hypothetical protein
MADSQDQLAGTETVRIADNGRGKVARLDSEQGEVQLSIPLDERSRESAAVRQYDVGAVTSTGATRYDVGTGNDEPIGSPDHA